MDKGRSLVSVFLPTYNQERYIGEAIESALNQDYENMEIVVGDDCSTDSTWEIVKEYQRKYPDIIKSFQNENNLGVTGNCNEVLARCTGDYIAFHAGDDLFLPGKILKQLEIMERDRGCVLTYHNIQVFESESGQTIKYWNTGDGSRAPIAGGAGGVAQALVEQGTGFMAALSVVVRREALNGIRYDSRVPIASDWLIWIEVCARSSGKVQYIEEVLARYRRHDNNITNQNKDDVTDTFVTLALVEARYPELRNSVRRARGYQYYRLGVSCVSAGRYVDGRKHILLGVRMSLYSWKWLGWWLYSWLKQLGVIR